MQHTRNGRLSIATLALALGLSACAGSPPVAPSGAGNEPAGSSPAAASTSAEVAPQVGVESATGNSAAMAAEIQAMSDRVRMMGDNPSLEDAQQVMGDMTVMLDRMGTMIGGPAGAPMAGADMQQMQDMMAMMQGMGTQMQGMMGGVGTMTPTMTDMLARMMGMHATLDEQVTPGDPHHPTATP